MGLNQFIKVIPIRPSVRQHCTPVLLPQPHRRRTYNVVVLAARRRNLSRDSNASPRARLRMTGQYGTANDKNRLKIENQNI
jgi:hypothetical protein